MGFRDAIQKPEHWAKQELAKIIEPMVIDACLHHREHRMPEALRDRLIRRLPYGTKLKRICDLIDVDAFIAEKCGRAPSPTFAKVRSSGVDLGVDAGGR